MCRDIILRCPAGTSLQCGESCGADSCTGRCCNCVLDPNAVASSSVSSSAASVPPPPVIEDATCGPDSLCVRLDVRPGLNMCRDVGIECPAGATLQCGETCGADSCTGQCCNCVFDESRAPDAPLPEPEPEPEPVISSCGPDSICMRLDVRTDLNSCREIGLDCPSGSTLQCGEACGENSCTGQCCNCVFDADRVLAEPPPALCGPDSLCINMDVRPGENLCRNIGILCPDGTELLCGESCSDNSCTGGRCCNCAVIPLERRLPPNPYADFCREFPDSCTSAGVPLCGEDRLCVVMDVLPPQQICRNINIGCPEGTVLTCGETCGENSCTGRCCNCALPDGATPNGGGCTEDRQCQSGLCINNICVACNHDGDCGDERLCIARKCTPPPACGNGIVELKEACDDGNLVNGDGCSSRCRRENGRECQEDRNCESNRCFGNVCQPCTADDQCASRKCNDGTCLDLCGNRKLDAGEECDQGPDNSDVVADRCRTDCRNPRCGDAIADRNEQCDDGNGVSGDGCDRQCRIEVKTVAIDLPLSPLNASAIAQSHAPAGRTGPGAIGAMAVGAAAGWAWMRKKRRK